MHDLLLFLHLTAMALWLGSLVAALWLAVTSLRADQPGQRAWGLNLAQRLGARLSIPSSVLVLLAGIGMVISAGMVGVAKPVWFKVMEMGGGTLVLVAIPLLLWLGRRMVRAAEQSVVAATRSYVGALSAVAICQLGVLLAVSLRLQ